MNPFTTQSAKAVFTIFLVFISCLTLYAQQPNTSKLVIVIPDEAINEDLSDAQKPQFLFSKGTKDEDKSLKKLKSLSALKLVIYDLKDSSNNQEIYFDSDDLRENAVNFDYKGDHYILESSGKKIKMTKKAGRGPASSGSNEVIKIKQSSTPIDCSNHSPKHRYYDGDNISNDCCFYSGCL